MHSAPIYRALIDARTTERRRDALRVVTPRIARADSSQLRRWTAALTTRLKAATRSIPVERHAI